MRNLQELNAAREKANSLLAKAHEFGVSIGQKPKAEQTAELDAQFNALFAEATSAQKEYKRLESLDTIAVSQEGLTAGSGVTGTRESHVGARALSFADLRAEMRNTRKSGRVEFRVARAEAFTQFLRTGTSGEGAARFSSFVGDLAEKLSLTPQERQALVNIEADLGGFLSPDEFATQVLRDLAGFAVIRPIARVMQTSRPALTFPTIQSATVNSNIYATGYAGAWKAEGYVTGGTAPTVQNQPTFGQTRVPVHVWAPNAIEVTQELLEDSEADLEGILSQIIAETLGLDEDSAFINGTGVGQPQGLLSSAAGLSTVKTGNATAVTYNGLVDLFTNLPMQYRQKASWLMSSTTLGAILKLVDTYGRPLFPVNSALDSLWGKPIVVSEFMPAVAASANPILFGNFNYFGVVDRRDLRIQRLNERFAPNVGLLPTRRTGGQVLRTAAFKLQVVST